jgi:hypothetical protein
MHICCIVDVESLFELSENVARKSILTPKIDLEDGLYLTAVIAQFMISASSPVGHQQPSGGAVVLQ